MNQNDADRIRTVLQSLNMQEAENQETADVIVFVTCSIRQHAEDRVFGLLQRCSQQRKKNRFWRSPAVWCKNQYTTFGKA